MKPDYEDAIRANEVDYDLGRYIAESSALSSGDLRAYEMLTGKDVIPAESHQELGKKLFNYTPLSFKLDEQTKAIEKQGKDVIKAVTGDSRALVIPDKKPPPPPPPGFGNLSTYGDLKNYMILMYQDLKNDKNNLLKVDKGTNYKDKRKNEVGQHFSPVKLIDKMIETPEESHDLYVNNVSDLEKRNTDVSNAKKVSGYEKELLKIPTQNLSIY